MFYFLQISSSCSSVVALLLSSFYHQLHHLNFLYFVDYVREPSLELDHVMCVCSAGSALPSFFVS